MLTYFTYLLVARSQVIFDLAAAALLDSVLPDRLSAVLAP